jgi:hypothetical protein
LPSSVPVNPSSSTVKQNDGKIMKTNRNEGMGQNSIVAGRLIQKKPTPGKNTFALTDDDSDDLSPEQGVELMEKIKKCKNYRRSPCFKLKLKDKEEKEKIEDSKNVSLTPFADLINILPNSDSVGVVRQVRVKIN